MSFTDANVAVRFTRVRSIASCVKKGLNRTKFEDNTIAHYVLDKWPGECELKDRAEKYIVEKI